MITERFLNAALFFNEKTDAMDTIKLYKLLFLADRDCIKKTGHTITEAIYKKIKPWGPVPLEVKALVDGMAGGDEAKEIIASHLKVEKQGSNTHIEISGKANMDYFSKEEIAILENLARKYKHRTGKSIAHGVHQMRGIKTMDWEKEFNMDIFLSQQDREKIQCCRNSANRLKISLAHA